MWLLDTYSLEQRWFHAPPEESGDNRYAILSHVWDPSGEQTLQDIRNIVGDTKVRPPLGLTRFLETRRSRPSALWDDERISAKVRKCCAFARKMGYRYVWIDSCCIDKTSSAELSEAINSMFQWYSRAAVCYALLDDVDDADGHPASSASAFRRSRWFTRGWTLQELIAPRDVLFLSKNWEMLGTKEDLADVIEEITGVDLAILLLEKSLDSEEILRKIPDQSIFVWGPGPNSIVEQDKLHNLSRFERRTVGPALYLAMDLHGRSFVGSAGGPPEERYLLAPSPRSFQYSAGISLIDIDALAWRLNSDVASPQYTITSYGIRTRLPVVPLLPGSPFSLGILSCQDEEERLIALILRKSSRPGQYTVGLDIESNPDFRRAVCLGSSPPSPAADIRLVSETTVCVPHRPAQRGTEGSGDRNGWLLERMFCAPCTVVIPHWNMVQLRRREIVPAWEGDNAFCFKNRSAEPVTLEFRRTPSLPAASDGQPFFVRLSPCPINDSRDSTVLAPRWPLHVCAALQGGNDDCFPMANCLEDHVADWKDGSKTWALSSTFSLTLRFKNWPCGGQTSLGIMIQPIFAMEVQVLDWGWRIVQGRGEIKSGF
ncbi:heterokaryon incompatibility protein-domain-containing protein [Trametes maxima]|nr:heterokaryon incompatibility protein-domain-containing protein [Trametes maxima]